MRKALVISCLAALFVLGTVSFALAGEEMKKEGSAHHAMAGEMHKVVGEIVSVDAAANTFVVKESIKKGAETKEMTFMMDPKGKVMSMGKAAAIADLKAGDMVTVHFHKKGEQMMVHEVVIAKAMK